MTVKFESEINNGNISIPDRIRRQLKDHIRVVVTLKEVESLYEEPYDIISELIKNPIKLHDKKPLTRNEIYDRT